MKLSPKNQILWPLAVVMVSLISQQLQAQFDSGSDETHGPITTVDGQTTTLQAPPDGVFHCTTVNVVANSTLNFQGNVANTPIYILATGDINIDGIVEVNGAAGVGSTGGLAGPGGFDGGNGSSAGQPEPGQGFGPGGGRNGNARGPEQNGGFDPNAVGHAQYASTAISRPFNGPVYGNNILIPLIGGSGGGAAGGLPGGGGGGAILFASNTKVVCNGIIGASGAHAGNAGAGSGGAIRIVSPQVEGTGMIFLLGGAVVNSNTATAAGAGKIRIDTLVRSFDFSYSQRASLSIGKNMVVFPPNLPKIEVIEAAGEAIDPNANLPVLVTIPPGSASLQPVKVRITNFAGTAQLKVVLTPENGPRIQADLDIDASGGGSVEGSVDVDFPANQLTRIDVWTR